MPDEIHNAIVIGLIKLVTLRLRGAPPAEAVTTVAEVWLETLARRDWQTADVARIEYAFRRSSRQPCKAGLILLIFVSHDEVP